jgi:hypothetical protein
MARCVQLCVTAAVCSRRVSGVQHAAECVQLLDRCGCSCMQAQGRAGACSCVQRALLCCMLQGACSCLIGAAAVAVTAARAIGAVLVEGAAPVAGVAALSVVCWQVLGAGRGGGRRHESGQVVAAAVHIACLLLRLAAAITSGSVQGNQGRCMEAAVMVPWL